MPFIRELKKAGYSVKHTTSYKSKIPNVKCDSFSNSIEVTRRGESEISDKIVFEANEVMIDVEKEVFKDYLTVYSNGNVRKRQVTPISAPVAEIIKKCNLTLLEE